MSPEDQKNYGPGLHPSYQEDHHPAPKNDVPEREEQRNFASHCLLRGYPCVWHSTAHRSKASIGCPDFIVGVNRVTLWIEFKRPGFGLSEDQEKFRDLLLGQGIQHYVVYSHAEAIALTDQFDRITLELAKRESTH